MPETFDCKFVKCKHHDKENNFPREGQTRLLRSIPGQIRTHLINSPTEAEPLLILCNDCKRISSYLEHELGSMHFADIELSGNTPFYMVEIPCETKSCEPPTRVYTRCIGDLPLIAEHAKQDVLKALQSENAKCRKGHPLKFASARIENIPDV
jgi:hypothetical protein